jgi:hypothetical protein
MMNSSNNLKCDSDCIQQTRIAEWLEQTFDGPLIKKKATNILIRMRCNEYDRNPAPTQSQLPLQVGSGHPWHRDIENQASRSIEIAARKERLGRRERLGRKSELDEEVWQRLANGFIVVHY